MHRRTLLIACVVPLLSGCEGLKRKDQTSRLDSSLTAYAGAVRWGNFETAQAFSRPRTVPPRPFDPATADGLKVTGYTIRVNSVNAAGDEANVSLSFTYYLQDSGRVNRAEQTNTWYYDEAGRAWLLDGNLPQFRR